MNNIRILKDGSISHISNHDTLSLYGSYNLTHIFDFETSIDVLTTVGDNRYVIPYKGSSFNPDDFREV